MGGPSAGNASVQRFFPTPKSSSTTGHSSGTAIGDGFTSAEIQNARTMKSDNWHPDHEYVDCEISALYAGPHAVTFMGRIANIFDLSNTPKTPRSAQGCIKLCVKDSGGAITVRVWYASRPPAFRLGSLISVWTHHISHSETGTLSSTNAPLFVSLFPERDRNCHVMVHGHSDCGMFKTPLGYREGVPLHGLMTLRNFIEGGYDVKDAKILVVVKSIGPKRKVVRKDQIVSENVNLVVHDNTATATLGLWGTLASSPSIANVDTDSTSSEALIGRSDWVSGETVLLIQSPGCKICGTTYLSFNSTTIADINPCIPDTDWLRGWSLRQKSREAINPPFPENVFDIELVSKGPLRCLFTIAELDEFARCAPSETFQGFFSILVVETKLFDLWRRKMLLSGECCNIPAYANSLRTTCKDCNKNIDLRLNPHMLGRVVDETAAIAAGRLLFSEKAWRDLLGRPPEELLKLGYDEIKYVADRLLFCRLTLMFGWTGDESKAGGRICVLRVLP